MTTTLTIADIKRRGMSAIEEALASGPVHLMKRNKPAAVILSQAAYAELLANSAHEPPGMTALDWLLENPPEGRLARERIDAELNAERSW